MVDGMVNRILKKYSGIVAFVAVLGLSSSHVARTAITTYYKIINIFLFFIN
jgi:hypothetical protein